MIRLWIIMSSKFKMHKMTSLNSKGAIGVEDVEILTQFAYYTGDQMHHEGVAVNLG